MDITLKIDNREPDNIKKEFSNAVFDNLNVGDYIYECNGIPKLIIERKTINDLSCSIKDGRFRDQRKRMLETNIKIVYIIEGNVIHDRMILGALENLAIRHNICLIPTQNEKQTIDVLKSLMAKCGQEYIPPVDKYTTGKKKQDVNKTSLEKMLETIVGVSSNIAHVISEHYSNVYEFTQKLNKHPNMLYGFEVGPNRKLGPKLAQRIYESFNK